MVSVAPRPFTLGKKDVVPTVEEIVWAPEPVWSSEENLSPHRDSIPGPSNP